MVFSASSSGVKFDRPTLMELYDCQPYINVAVARTAAGRYIPKGPGFDKVSRVAKLCKVLAQIFAAFQSDRDWLSGQKLHTESMVSVSNLILDVRKRVHDASYFFSL
jgi:hypothetical protein